MSFADSMRSTALSLIGELGSSIELKKIVTTGKVYNPVTDEYEGTDESIIVNTKCAYTQLNEGDNSLKEIESIKRVAWVAYTDEISGLDNTWLANGNKIYSVKQLEAQDKKIVFKIYIG